MSTSESSPAPAPTASLPAALFAAAFPFHVVIEAPGTLVQVGARLAALCPHAVTGAALSAVFEDGRAGTPLEWDRVLSSLGRLVLWRVRDSALTLRGQVLRDGDVLYALMEPWISNVDQLRGLGLSLDDFPPSSALGDMLVLMQSKDTAFQDLRALNARLQQTTYELRAQHQALEDELQQRKRLEAQLRQSQKMDALGQLAGGIAHDFNNVLMAILSTGQLALDELEGHPSRHDVKHMLTAAGQAAGLVRKLLSFGQNHPWQAQALDAAREVRELCSMLRRTIGEHITLECVVPTHALWIEIDPTALQQIVTNLVLNARDAMGEAGGTLYVGLTAAPQAGPDGGPRVLLTVTDEGVGIAPDVLERVFEPFFTTKAFGEGSGLGLSVVDGLVRQAGGRIELKSAPHAGTSVTVSLPGRSAPAASEAPALEPAVPVAPGAPRTVLVVDDAELVLRTLSRTLRRHGYKVLTATSADEALGLLRTGQVFDLMLSDVVMPGMSGVELMERARRLCPEMHVVLMTGYAPDDLHAAHALDDVPLLHKPFAPSQLFSMLDGVLSEGAS